MINAAFFLVWRASIGHTKNALQALFKLFNTLEKIPKLLAHVRRG